MYSILLYSMSRQQSGRPAPTPSSGPGFRGASPERRRERGERSAHRGRTRVTFRVPQELAEALRDLPNQTAFVERTLRDALGHLCPMCHGTGAAPGVHLNVSNLKLQPVRPLDRATAAQLKALVRLGRQLLATELELGASGPDTGLEFRLAREEELLLSGIIPLGQGEVALKH